MQENKTINDPTERIISKIKTSDNVGFESHINTRFQLGYILSGEKHFVENERRVICRRGDIFFTPIGNHHIENIVSVDAGGIFEQIALTFTSEHLNKVLIPLNLSLTKNPSVATIASHPPHRRAHSRSHEVSLRNKLPYNMGGFNDNPISEMVNLTNLLHTILTHESETMLACIINSIDKEQADFERVIFDNIFSDKRIEELAHEAHRSLTSFKKSLDDFGTLHTAGI